MRTRVATLSRASGSIEQVKRYLPANYQLHDLGDPQVLVIAGEDSCGWTLDEYVIPRLASGLIFAEEVEGREAAKWMARIELVRALRGDRERPVEVLGRDF